MRERGCELGFRQRAAGRAIPTTAESPRKETMMKIGYFLSSEEFDPHSLIEQARTAEESGFGGGLALVALGIGLAQLEAQTWHRRIRAELATTRARSAVE